MVKPFLRWVGGKRWLWKLIKPFLIQDTHDTYVEPCLGGGAIAIHFMKYCKKHNINKRFVLSDMNPKLVNCWKQVRDNLDAVVAYIDNIEDEYETASDAKAYHAKIRDKFNRDDNPHDESAAMFIWLNKNSYRGLYRVNKRGDFNTPFGTAVKPYEYYSLAEVSSLLREFAEFRPNGSFERFNMDACYFLDPPYIGVFNEYTTNEPISTPRIHRWLDRLPDNATVYLCNNQNYFARPGTADVLLLDRYERERMHPDADASNQRVERVWLCTNAANDVEIVDTAEL